MNWGCVSGTEGTSDTDEVLRLHRQQIDSIKIVRQKERIVYSSHCLKLKIFCDLIPTGTVRPLSSLTCNWLQRLCFSQ